VVVFDEAHNIDDVCIEAYSVKLNKPILFEAAKNLKFVNEKISENKADIRNRL
jgi:DNA excision repair protein ERCC-2